MKTIYVANIIVAGCISLVSIISPNFSARTIFSNAYSSTEVIRLVGCLWLAIAVMSIFGLFKPIQFSPVFVVQLIYKGMWLLVVALPAIVRAEPFPGRMAVFFIVWVCILPLVIPWKYLFA